MLALAALLGLLNCDAWTTQLERDPKTIALDEIISLTVDAPAGIPADGKSTMRVNATIPIDATPSTVKFTTNAGLFVETGATEVSILAVADAANKKRVASTLLKADTIAATAILRATIADFYDTLSVRFIK